MSAKDKAADKLQSAKGKVKKNVGTAQAEFGDAKERFKSNVKDADKDTRP